MTVPDEWPGTGDCVNGLTLSPTFGGESKATPVKDFRAAFLVYCWK